MNIESVRDWLKLTHGEKMSSLIYAAYESTKRWERK